VKFKLDENIGGAAAEVLIGAGYDVATVHSQRLGGITDDLLLSVCIQENRSLVTLDRGIGRAFSLLESDAVGVAVLDIGTPQSRRVLVARLRQLAALLEKHELAGSVWILEAHSVRMHRAG